MKKIFIAIVLSFVLIPSVAWGVDNSIDPEFNPICWKEEECIKTRKTYGASDAQAKEGFLHLESPCNKQGYGKCLPAGVASTSIKFGGESQFANIGEFIKTNYNYLLGIAGILAVIMIIVAGAQWVTSGGSSEVINSAKKRIFGAVVGLIIAFSSYAILNTINPALVNLRLPQTFMIRTVPLSFDYCSKSPVGTMFNEAGTSDKVLTKDDFLKVTDFPLSVSDTKKLKCGYQYFVARGGGATCLGDYCEVSGDEARVCLRDVLEKDKKVYKCVSGIVGGKVTFNSLSKELFPGWYTEDWDYPPIDDGETELWSVCNDGSTDDVGRGDKGSTIDDKNQTYLILGSFSDLEHEVEDCKNSGGLKGFVLMFEMNENHDPTDEEHLLGWDGGNLKDLGDEGFFNKYVTKINSKYFIPLDAFKKGLVLNLEAASVFDIDEPSLEKDWSRYTSLLN